MEVVLGIDIGTSSSKGLLVTPDGQVVEATQRTHHISLPRPGWAEADAEGTWWDEVRAICNTLVSSAPGPILGVCVSGVGPSLVLCDADLVPLRPAILYGIDTRATEEIDLITHRHGKEAILNNAGKYLTSQALGPKIEWVRQHEPDVWQAARGWYGCHSYVVAKLTGEYVLDHHTASQCDPLYQVSSVRLAARLGEDRSATPCRCPVSRGRGRSSARSIPRPAWKPALPPVPPWSPGPSTLSPRPSALGYAIRVI